MAFEKILYRTWHDNTLFAVLLELTYRCNLDCFFCYNDLGLQGRALGTERYLRLLDELAEMEVMNLILSGGEPLAHPDFFRIGGRARELGFVVRVKSNGHGLRGKVAQRLKQEVDPYVVDVSLHGGCAETHDRQTRVAGSFDRLMENLPQLVALGVRLKVNATLTRWNEDEIDGMLAIADRLEIPITINPVVSPRDDGDREPLSIAPSRDARLRLYRVLAERGERRRREREDRDVARTDIASGGTVATATGMTELARPGDDGLPAPAVDKSCGAGSSGVTIDPFGNVLPCVQWRRPVGNLHHQTLREIWQGSSGLREVREQTREAHRRISEHGERGKLMNFCAGLALSHTGDPLAIYDDAREQADLVGRVLDEQAERERDRSPERRELLPVLR